MDFREKETAWDPIDYKPYLGASRLCPIDGEVKKLADEIIKGGKTVQAKALASGFERGEFRPSLPPGQRA